jgi:type II secretory ATPase GspE/PulE/Tfp pilus assembly ATPase PilB-like protein
MTARVPEAGGGDRVIEWTTFPAGISPETVIGVVDTALASLARLEVSDLHLEPRGGSLYAVRLRKDGVFLDGGRQTVEDAGRIIARLKVMARLAVHRSDIPQEGALALPGGRGSGRLSTFPTVNGERAVLRLLEAGAAHAELDELGLEPDLLSLLRRLLAARQGLVLVCGPSGAGKTTTLYAAVREIHRAEGRYRSIATLEDPVERNLGFVAQTEVCPERGLTFPAGLRALLRQDPEVLMVGEVRDRESAQIATQAALTGHLVLSSLHTSSAVEALARLRDLGVDPGLTAGALRGVLCQRLVPLACRHDRGDGSTSALAVADCTICRGSGLAGRRASGELLVVGRRVRDLIRSAAPAEQLEEAAIASGLVPLWRRVQELVDRGIAHAQHVSHLVEPAEPMEARAAPCRDRA